MEGKCSLCNLRGELLEVITGDGIVGVCIKCADKNKFPLVKKPKEPEKDSDKELKSIVARGIRKRDYSNLVDNFHWHIQQARRFKKISQKQLGEAIAEPEIIIAMAEKGELPEDYEKIIVKMEQFLSVHLFKEKKSAGYGWIADEGVDIKKAEINQITVGDLKKIHEEKFGEVDDEKDEEQDEKDEEMETPGFFSRIFGGWKKGGNKEGPAKTL